MQDDKAEGLKLIEERISVTKPRVVTGRVRVRTETEAYEDVARAELDWRDRRGRAGGDDRRRRRPPRRPGPKATSPSCRSSRRCSSSRHACPEGGDPYPADADDRAVEAPVTLRRQRAIVERTGPRDRRPSERTPELQPARTRS